MSKSNRCVTLLSALLVLHLLFTGCRHPEEHRGAGQQQPSLLHAVHSEQLHQVMGELGRLAGDRLPQELDLGRERRRRVENLVEIATALSRSADRISDVLTEVDLSPEHRREFLDLAEALRLRAVDLADRAPDLTLAEVRTRVEGINASCQECHRRFRVLPVVSGG